MYNYERPEAGVFLIGVLLTWGDNWEKRRAVAAALRGVQTEGCVRVLFDFHSVLEIAMTGLVQSVLLLTRRQSKSCEAAIPDHFGRPREIMFKERLCAVFILALAVMLLMVSAGQAGETGSSKKWPGRLGIVVLQFDDSTAGHFTHAFPILEKYGLKGSFGVVSGNFGKPGSLTSDEVVQIHRAGHEVHDHTLDHNAAMWGDPSRKAEWAAHTEKSLGILRDLGIVTRGWNHPGGAGSRWTPELHEFLLPHYDYVAGRVNLKPEEQYNIHWHLKDHPFSLGYGGLGSIPRRDSIDASRKDIASVKTRIADGIQQGLVVIPLWHTVKDEDGTAWGLEEVCKFVRQHNLPTMLMADAVRAIQDTRRYYGEQVEQIANPGFQCDYDENGRPDGYQGCRYAANQVRDAVEGRVAEFDSGAVTWIYGPETGLARLTVRARSMDEKPCKLAVSMTCAEIDGSYRYRLGEPQRLLAADLGPTWSEHETTLAVGPEVDRIKITVELSPPGKAQVSRLSWRKTP